MNSPCVFWLAVGFAVQSNKNLSRVLRRHAEAEAAQAPPPAEHAG